MSFCKRLAVTAVLGLCLSTGCANADGLPVSASQVSVRGAGPIAYELKDNAITMRIDVPRKDTSLQIRPPEGQAAWDFSRATQLAVDVENLSKDKQLRLNMQVAGPHAGKRRDANVGVGLNPGEKRTLRLPLPHEWKFAPPTDVPGIRTFDTSEISEISFFLQWPYEFAMPGLVDCRLTNLRLEGEEDPTTGNRAPNYVPFIDVYGQFIHVDWPEKVRSADDLKRARVKELAELDTLPRPADWNRFGGWANGPKLRATGSFRVEKYEGKWWLVDPEGRLFFSHGLDVLSTYNDPLKVLPGKENWFAELPPGVNRYQPTELALTQKYGTEDYRADYYDTLARRLEAWGMNSIGDWSRYELMHLGKTPYTLQLTDYDYKMPRIGNSNIKFYDVFDPRYIEKMKNLLPQMMEKDPIYRKSIDDPMCIGYFIDNELNFGNRGSRQTLVDAILRAPAKQVAKQEFARDLQAKYKSVETLNQAWGTQHASWEAFLEATTVPETAAYRADAGTFFKRMLDQYFRLARDAVKSAAPNRLYLGVRFVSTDSAIPELYETCAKYADVLSVNIYSFSPANFPRENYPDVPVLIGEFQFGLLQRGMFSASLCAAGVSPEDRAHAYTRFMQGALVHPNIVGAHYFQYRDQPLTGRGDSEAYQIGFVDVTDTPYPEMTRAARAVGLNLYTYRNAGKLVDFEPEKR